MNIPPYWICERHVRDGKTRRRYAASATSLEDARQALATAAPPIIMSEDEYHTPVYEQILSAADEHNIVTRNHYGCEVLNTTTVCFADVDTVPNPLMNALRSLFGRGLTAEERLLQRVRELCAADAGLGVRVYRTAHGWRLVLAGQGISLLSPRMEELFRLLPVDPRYARMCRLQRCWRARVSPKPFYRGLKRFPLPLHSDWQADPAAAEWVRAYQAATADLAVCRLIATLGTPIDDPIVNWHDETTSALRSDLELG